MNENKRDDKIDSAFEQLEGALCIWARAKGEQPLKKYFYEVMPNVRRMILDNKVYEIVLTVVNDEKVNK